MGSVPDRPPPLANMKIRGKILSWQTRCKEKDSNLNGTMIAFLLHVTVHWFSGHQWSKCKCLAWQINIQAQSIQAQSIQAQSIRAHTVDVLLTKKAHFTTLQLVFCSNVSTYSISVSSLSDTLHTSDTDMALKAMSKLPGPSLTTQWHEAAAQVVAGSL